MKKIVAGIGFEFTGIAMLLFSTIVTSMNIASTTEWDTQLGRYWQTMSNMGLFPLFILGVLLLASGIGFSLWGVFSKNDK